MSRRPGGSSAARKWQAVGGRYTRRCRPYLPGPDPRGDRLLPSETQEDRFDLSHATKPPTGEPEGPQSRKLACFNVARGKRDDALIRLNDRMREGTGLPARIERGLRESSHADHRHRVAADGGIADVLIVLCVLW